MLSNWTGLKFCCYSKEMKILEFSISKAFGDNNSNKGQMMEIVFGRVERNTGSCSQICSKGLL